MSFCVFPLTTRKATTRPSGEIDSLKAATGSVAIDQLKDRGPRAAREDKNAATRRAEVTPPGSVIQQRLACHRPRIPVELQCPQIESLRQQTPVANEQQL